MDEDEDEDEDAKTEEMIAEFRYHQAHPGFKGTYERRRPSAACGSRKVDARPELYPGGVVAMRERWRRD